MIGSKALTATSTAVLAAAAAALLSYGAMIGTASRAEAGMCYDLWYARNAIYAAKGYCFKGCGRRVWSANCFPPYGRLSRGEWRRVKAIQRQERINGCPRCPASYE